METAIPPLPPSALYEPPLISLSFKGRNALSRPGSDGI